MNSIDFRLKGTAPLLFHKEPSPYEEAKDASNGRKSKDDPLVEQARRCLHLTTPNGKSKKPEAMIPAFILRKCLQSRTSLVLGRSTAGHPWVQIVRGGVLIEPAELVIAPQDWTLDVRRAGSKGRSAPLLYRPRFDVWGIAGTVVYDDKHLSGQDVRGLFDEAGRSQGLGSYRIGNGGPFGSFIVTEWKE